MQHAISLTYLSVQKGDACGVSSMISMSYGESLLDFNGSIDHIRWFVLINMMKISYECMPEVCRFVLLETLILTDKNNKLMNTFTSYNIMLKSRVSNSLSLSLSLSCFLPTRLSGWSNTITSHQWNDNEARNYNAIHRNKIIRATALSLSVMERMNHWQFELTFHRYQIFALCSFLQFKNNIRSRTGIFASDKQSLSFDVAVIQWITSCHKNRMTTRYITLGYWHVTSWCRPWQRNVFYWNNVNF